MKFQVMPPVMEKELDITQHSLPKCAIKYYGFYIALLCYLTAIRNETIHTDYVSNSDVYSFEMSERGEDQETLLTMLEEGNKNYTWMDCCLLRILLEKTNYVLLISIV